MPVEPRRGAAAARGGEGVPDAARGREPRRRQQARRQHPQAGRSEGRNASTAWRAASEPEERALHDAIRAASDKAKPLYEKGDYTGYLKSFAVLKAPVDAFFDKVMVMVEDEKLRRSRLALLRDLREAMNRVADLSKLRDNEARHPRPRRHHQLRQRRATSSRPTSGSRSRAAWRRSRASRRPATACVVATNQSGIGARPVRHGDADRDPRQAAARASSQAGGRIDAFFFCPHTADSTTAAAASRSPACCSRSRGASTSRSRTCYMVGDALRDLEAAAAAGAQPVLVLTGNGAKTRDEGNLPRGTDGLSPTSRRSREQLRSMTLRCARSLFARRADRRHPALRAARARDACRCRACCATASSPAGRALMLLLARDILGIDWRVEGRENLPDAPGGDPRQAPVGLGNARLPADLPAAGARAEARAALDPVLRLGPRADEPDRDRPQARRRGAAQHRAPRAASASSRASGSWSSPRARASRRASGATTSSAARGSPPRAARRSCRSRTTPACCWPRNAFLKRPGTVTVRIGPASTRARAATRRPSTPWPRNGSRSNRRHWLIELDGRTIEYRFARRRRRTLGLTVDAHGLTVVAPLRAPWREIDAFLREKRALDRRQARRMGARAEAAAPARHERRVAAVPRRRAHARGARGRAQRQPRRRAPRRLPRRAGARARRWSRWLKTRALEALEPRARAFRRAARSCRAARRGCPTRARSGACAARTARSASPGGWCTSRPSSPTTWSRTRSRTSSS